MGVVDDEHLDEICKYIMDWDGYVYYDTETTGLNINFKSRVGQADQLVGVVLSEYVEAWGMYGHYIYVLPENVKDLGYPEN